MTVTGNDPTTAVREREENGMTTFWVDGVRPEDAGYPGFAPGTSTVDGMLVERDVTISLRDGAHLYADVYRPAVSADPVPVLLAWSSYGKHGGLRFEQFGAHGVDVGALSAHTRFEAPDPVWWTSRGYAVALPDPRGSWNSPGDNVPFGPQEVSDACDVIGWLGRQEWSNGRVGMSGVSYFSIIQWLVAAQRPEHLHAINPWEGVSDPYRELFLHGGIPETAFMGQWQRMLRASRGRVEDFAASIRAHPLLDGWALSKTPDLSAIDVPAYVVASWSDHGLHTRGTLEGFRRIASREKFLQVHGRKKWAHYYDERSLLRQEAFFDTHLKDGPSRTGDWPEVEIEVRERAYAGDTRAESEWPPARTRYEPLHLVAGAKLSRTPAERELEIGYDAATGSAGFDLVFDEDTEVTGYMALRLWVEARGSDDMDLFVGVRKLDASGTKVDFPFFAKFDDGDVALGWLRASHRELDPERSTPFQPVHPHTREQRLAAGEVVPVDIEIWASSTLFERGSTLRLIVQGHDLRSHEQFTSQRHDDTRNAGTHVLHLGGRHDSHLLLPVIGDGAGAA